MSGFTAFCKISKGTFETSRKMLNPYIVKYAFYWLLFFSLWWTITWHYDVTSFSETTPSFLSSTVIVTNEHTLFKKIILNTFPTFVSRALQKLKYIFVERHARIFPYEHLVWCVLHFCFHSLGNSNELVSGTECANVHTRHITYQIIGQTTVELICVFVSVSLYVFDEGSTRSTFIKSKTTGEIIADCENVQYLDVHH